MAGSNSKMSGVMVEASPVTVAEPYFCQKDGRKVKSEDVINFCSILTGNGVFMRETEKEIVASKVDLDTQVFQPIRNTLFTEGTNSLIALCHLAFADHRPMALTPDLLWHYISKGIAIHVHRHSETLRHKFVNHEGKMDLQVTRMKTNLTVDDWSGAIREFRDKIEATLSDDGKVLATSKFSTTSDIIEDVACIALMDTVAKYYSYRMVCICGIPSVTLLGTEQDWIDLRERSQHILDLLSTDDLAGDVSLAWWKPALLGALDRLIQCYRNPSDESNKDWMARIYKLEREGYGGHANVCGWINVVFPYLGHGEQAKEYKVNQYANNALLNLSDDTLGNFNKQAVPTEESDEESDYGFFGRVKKSERVTGNSGSAFPRAISSAPFTWVLPGEEYKMLFNGGPCCVSEQVIQDGYPCPPGTLHANFGWVIKHNIENRKG